MKKSNNTKFDIIVIGSGPGGFISANYFAKKGLSVCLLEKGDIPDINNFVGLKALENYYDNNGIIPVLSQSIFGFAQGKALGGGSVINGGLIWQLPMHTQKKWESLITKIEVDKILNNYEVIKKDLDVKDSKELNIQDNLDSEKLFNGSKKLNWKCISVPRALKKCVQNNNCGFGCPGLNKNSVDIVYKESFISNKGEIKTNTKCLKLNKKKNTIESITVETIGFGKYKLFAKNFILAAGAISSNLLLQESNITNKSYIQFHLNLKITALFDEDLNSEKGTMFTYQVQEFANKGTLFMPTNFTKESLLSTIYSFSKDQKHEILQNYSKLGLFVCQVQPNAIGKIFQILKFPLITYFLTKKDKENIKEAIINLSKLLFVSGAKKLYLPSTAKNNVISSIDQIDVVVNKITNWDFISVHSMSANRMGLVSKSSVTNIYGKVNNFNNLHIVDSSALPSSVGESPQGVIMANSLRISEKLFNEL